MSTAVEKSWHQKMAKHDELAKRGVKLLYDRVKLLTEILHDQEAVDELAAKGKDIYKILDDKVADTGQSFHILHEIFKRYPRKSQWTDQPVQRLYAKVIRDEQKERRENKKREKKEEQQAFFNQHGYWPEPEPKPKSAYQQLQEDHGDLVQRHEELQKKYDDLQKKYDAKCKECEELKAQLKS